MAFVRASGRGWGRSVATTLGSERGAPGRIGRRPAGTGAFGEGRVLLPRRSAPGPTSTDGAGARSAWSPRFTPSGPGLPDAAGPASPASGRRGRRAWLGRGSRPGEPEGPFEPAPRPGPSRPAPRPVSPRARVVLISGAGLGAGRRGRAGGVREWSPPASGPLASPVHLLARPAAAAAKGNRALKGGLGRGARRSRRGSWDRARPARPAPDCAPTGDVRTERAARTAGRGSRRARRLARGNGRGAAARGRGAQAGSSGRPPAERSVRRGTCGCGNFLGAGATLPRRHLRGSPTGAGGLLCGRSSPPFSFGSRGFRGAYGPPVERSVSRASKGTPVQDPGPQFLVTPDS